MVRHHHRTAASIALTLALTAAAPAAARPQLGQSAGAAHPSTQASTNLCSEVCGASGHAATTQPSVASAESGATLPHDPRVRSEALSRAAAGSPSSTIASSGSNGPRSEVVSGAGYSNPGGVATVVRTVTPGSGFHWGDAGIGAGAAVAMVTLLIGGLLLATNARRRATHSTARQTA